MPEIAERFEREAMAASNIHSPYIAAATDFGHLDDGSMYLIMEFVEGQTLRELIEAGPCPVLKAIKIAKQIGAALAAAHQIGIVHRDLKPENIMLSYGPQDELLIKVLDFGVARIPVDFGRSQFPAPLESVTPEAQVEKNHTQANMVFGTPEYMAPEQAMGAKVDASADLYALGIILYELLSANHPFNTSAELGILGEQLSKGAPPLRAKYPDLRVPKSLELCVSSLLKTEISERPKDASSLLYELERIAIQIKKNEAKPKTLADTDAKLLDEHSLIGDPIKKIKLNFAEATQSFDSHPLKRRKYALMGAVLITILASSILIFSGNSNEDTEEQESTALGDKTSPSALAPSASELSKDNHQEASQDSLVIEECPEPLIKEAEKKGEAALLKLEELYPNSPSLLISIALGQMKAGHNKQALEKARQLIRLDPAQSQDRKMAQLMWGLAQDTSLSPAVLDILAQSMGEKGAMVLFDLATVSGVSSQVAKLAMDKLRSKKVQTESSVDVDIAIRLLLAKDCAARAELVPDIAEHGGERSAELLTELSSKKGCTAPAKLCNPCLDPKAVTAALQLARQR